MDQAQGNQRGHSIRNECCEGAKSSDEARSEPSLVRAVVISVCDSARQTTRHAEDVRDKAMRLTYKLR